MLRTETIKLSAIKAMELAAAKTPGAVSLAQGIPSFDTPDIIKNFMVKAITDGKAAKYSLVAGLPQLREIVAENLARDGMAYDPETEIIITAGAIEAINATLQTILSPGDEVIIPSPTYASYAEVVKIAHGVPKFAKLDEADDWAVNLRAFKGQLTPKTKAIFLSNPNNPTGTMYSRKQLLELADLAKRHRLYIITDEVYKDFVYDDSPYWSLAQEKTLRDRVIRVFAFSKAYAMTGYRIGFLHTDASLAEEILKVHDGLITCAPVVSQYGAIAAFDYAEESVKKFREEFLKRRDYAMKRLAELADYFSFSKPQSSYFLFPKAWRADEDLAWDILREAKVATVPGAAFGPGGEGHLRMCFGVAPETLGVAFDRLAEYCKSQEKP